MSESTTIDHRHRRPLSREEIFSHPLFPEIEKDIAIHLMAIHTRSPRLARLKASHRKWLMTHCLYALSLERNPGDPLSGLTVTRMIDAVVKLGAASHNTVASFLSELVTYKFLRESEGVPDRRIRVLEVTEISERAMMDWYLGHMMCLDRLDQGNRSMLANADPHLFRLVQPQAARILLQDPGWKDPPDSIGSFLWSDLGGMVLHDLISRLPDIHAAGDRILLGPLPVSQLADTYGISPTNVKRMFRKAEDDTLLGWEFPRRRGNFWITRSFLDDYFRWQSVKFMALDQAFHQAVMQLYPHSGSASATRP